MNEKNKTSKKNDVKEVSSVRKKDELEKLVFAESVRKMMYPKEKFKLIVHEHLFDNMVTLFKNEGYDMSFINTPEGKNLKSEANTTVLSEENEQGRVLESVEEFIACQNEDIEYSRKHFRGYKYDFYYRVEERFFDNLLNSEYIEDFECSDSDKDWLLEQLNKFKAVYDSFDFKNNYYYVVDSY